MNSTSNFDGYPGTTVLFTATADSVYTMAGMGVDTTAPDGARAHMAIISVETQSARLAFTADASATLGHLKAAGALFQVNGAMAIRELTLRNAVNGSNFTAQITPFFPVKPA
jgi:hypothetical protein